MLRRFISLAIFIVTVTVFAGVHVSAQTIPLTNEHLQRIKDNCQQAQATLTHLHARDALLRVNRGQVYDLLSTKMMARMNSRLAINRLDASKLISSTASFDRALSDFREKFQNYERQLSSTLRINCQQQPAQFYDAVTSSRSLRQSVHQSVQDLDRYMTQYRHEFDIFKDAFNKQPAKTGDNV